MLGEKGKNNNIMVEKILGIDIGATKIHIGVVQDETIIDEAILSTSSHASKEQILQEIIKAIDDVITPDVIGIGIGAPGLIDEKKGIVYDVQNIASWQEVHLKKYVEDYFNKPVHVTNDANTFVLGEKIYGKAKLYKNIIGITLGTGLGTGIIINNNLYSGAFSSAGEMGGVPYLDLTIEDYCSGKFFDKLGKKGNEVYKLAQKGDAEALDLFNQFGGHVGNLVKTILFAFSPQAIFLGGSISKCYPFFREAMEESIQQFPFKRITNQLVIEPSEISNAAILGAAALVKINEAEKKKSIV